jgi:hypothetical protein
MEKSSLSIYRDLHAYYIYLAKYAVAGSIVLTIPICRNIVFDK